MTNEQVCDIIYTERTKKEDKKMNKTFTIKANNGQSPLIEITYAAPSYMRMHACVKILQRGFRDIQVTCDQTGEIYLTLYKCSEMFKPETSPANALLELEEFLSIYN